MSPEALAWQAEVLGLLMPDAVRVAAPLWSRGGALVVEGWTAWPLVAGGHARRWPEIIAVGERFHDALTGIPRPAALRDAGTDPWARADRIAWGELSANAAAAHASRGPVAGHRPSTRSPSSPRRSFNAA